jgi:TolB-like protein
MGLLVRYALLVHFELFVDSGLSQILLELVRVAELFVVSFAVSREYRGSEEMATSKWLGGPI